MRIKFKDKIYRLKEIESGVDSLMELVEEPKYKEGDFLHSDWCGENITIIYRKRNGNHLYYHASKSNFIGLCFDKKRFWRDDCFRLATESEKKELIDALAEVGKRWSADKKCIEDIPKRKFKAGDKVTLKSGCTSNPNLTYYSPFDEYIGKELIVIDYTGSGNVKCNNGFRFAEDWLEPWSDEPKVGDWVVAWSDGKIRDAIVGVITQIDNDDNTYFVGGFWFENVVKWDGTKEHIEKVQKE